MDVLINQITQIFNNNKDNERNEAAAKALKEIILSALSRSGFLKSCPYLSKMDQSKNNMYYLIFLNQSGNISKKEHWHAVNCELDAAGLLHGIKENETGFSIEYEGVTVSVFIYQKDFNLKSEYTYQLQPIPYELRSISSMSEGIRAEIEKALESVIETPKISLNKIGQKNNSSKNKEKSKKKKEPDEHWIQPSLFAF